MATDEEVTVDINIDEAVVEEVKEAKVPYEKKIIDPYWGNVEKTQVVCIFIYPDGTSSTASVMNSDKGTKDNPDWVQVFRFYTEDDITKATEARLENRDAHEEDLIIQTKAEREKKKNEDIFQAKIDAFQIEEVKGSTDRTTKAKIRKAKTLTEVIAYSTLLIMKASEKKPAKKKKAAKKK